MSRLKASFWENPSEADVAGPDLVMDEDAEEEEWEREVVNSLESLANIAVEEGSVHLVRCICCLANVTIRAPSDSPYHISQLHIILDRTDGLLEAFAEGLRDGSYDPTAPE